MEELAAAERLPQIDSKAIYRYRLRPQKTLPAKWRTLLHKHVPNPRRYRFSITTVTGETYSNMDGEPTDEEIVYDLFVVVWDLGDSNGAPHGLPNVFNPLPDWLEPWNPPTNVEEEYL